MSEETQTPQPVEAEKLELIIEAIKPELNELVGPEQATRVRRSLGQYQRWARTRQGDEAYLVRAINSLESHPQVQARVKELQCKNLAELRSLTTSLTGEPDVQTPIYVCPVPGCGYKRALQHPPIPTCPTHGVKLIKKPG